MRAIPLWQQQLLIAAIASLSLSTSFPAYAHENLDVIAVAKKSVNKAFKHTPHRNERAPVVRARPDIEYNERQRPRSIFDVPVNRIGDRVPRNNSQNSLPSARSITNNQPRSTINNNASSIGRTNASSIINGNNNSDAERSQRSNSFQPVLNNYIFKRSQR